MKKADIGLIGLAVMGENLVMNMESKTIKIKQVRHFHIAYHKHSIRQV